jgi:hypothetical protein
LKACHLECQRHYAQLPSQIRELVQPSASLLN